MSTIADPTEEKIQLGLMALAYRSGNGRRAEADLKEIGVKISRKTLERWAKGKHQDEYERIRARELPKIKERAAQRHDAIAEAHQEVEVRLAQKLNEKIDDLPARDLPGALRNVTTSVGINRDKAQVLREGIGDRQQPPDLTAALRSLHSAGVANIKIEMQPEAEQEPPIDSTATELPQVEEKANA